MEALERLNGSHWKGFAEAEVAMQRADGAILGGLHAAGLLERGSVWLSEHGGTQAQCSAAQRSAAQARRSAGRRPRVRNVFRCTLRG